MTVLIDDDLFAIWWIHLPPQDRLGTSECDLLCSLIRRGETECEIVYRFRYYETDGAWDGMDRKNWYEGLVKQPAAELVPFVRDMFRQLSEMAGGSRIYEIMRGEKTTKEFSEEFMRQPFVHAKSGAEAQEWERQHPQRKPYRAPLPMHYAPHRDERIACPIEIIGTNFTSEPGDVTCKRCAKHADVINYRNDLRDKQKPPHA